MSILHLHFKTSCHPNTVHTSRVCVCVCVCVCVGVGVGVGVVWCVCVDV